MSCLTLFLLSSACVHETNRCEPSAAAIRAAIQRLIAADNARDLPQVISMYTQDVVFLPPTGEEVTGRQAVEARYQKLFATQAPRIRMEIAETRLSDDWAFVRGVTQGTLTSVSSGEVTTLDDRFIALLKCDLDAWRISRLMWHRADGDKPR